MERQVFLHKQGSWWLSQEVFQLADAWHVSML